ncbi:MAG: hypothetical protein ACLR0U_32535 [Enterocloster clostridioformis]
MGPSSRWMPRSKPSMEGLDPRTMSYPAPVLTVDHPYLGAE